jgi:uncharacterized protein (TIGR02001 family)
MREVALLLFLPFALFGSTSYAADLPTKAPPPPAAAPAPNWDIAFGGALMSDYEFRGITQSAHRPSVAAYSELRYNVNPSLQFYYGNSGESIDFPNHAAAEIDFYGGVRPTFDKLALDFGFWYYYYPGGTTFNGLGPPFGGPIGTPNASCTNLFLGAGGFCNTYKGNASFWEVYAKPVYTVNDNVAIGGNVYYSPSWLNSGAFGTYASGTLKLTAPSNWLPNGFGSYILGEVGYYWFGTTDAFYGNIKYPDYLTWNIGIDLTWKVFTLDLRYWDTNLSRANCNVLTGDHTASFNPGNITSINPSGLGSNWCGATFVAKLSADLTLNTNIK